jgi:hypothetical protein
VGTGVKVRVGVGVKVGVGVGRSSVKVRLVALTFPAMSAAERLRVWEPAERPADGTGTVWLAESEPPIRGAPSRVRLQDETPLVRSETVRLTFRLSPQPGQKEEGPVRLTCGGWLSTLPLALPMEEVSPKVECAQKVKSFWPSDRARAIASKYLRPAP